MKTIKSLVRELLLLPLTALGALAEGYNSLIALIRPGLGSIWLDRQVRKNTNRTMQVSHVSSGRELKLTLYTPSAICRYRANTFSTKEPETLAWIDEFGGGGALFDIGANVGLYSIYCAATKQSNVYAFEPSVFNLALLAKNINANNLQHRIRIISNPLTRANQFADFNLSTTEEGGALSAFGVDYGHDGKPIAKSLSYQTLGLSLDFLLASGVLPERPGMIKIDVDGIEHLILAGARDTLAHPDCRTVLIEVSSEFRQQAQEVSQILASCGFALRGAPPAAGSDAAAFNQIWIKSAAA